MAVFNWDVCNVECRCVAITGADIPVPCHMCRYLWLGWGLGTRWCVQRVPGHRLGCGYREMGCGVVALVVAGGRHAPLDWNSYCVHELTHNTLLLLFVFLLTIVASAWRLPCITMYESKYGTNKPSWVSISQVYVLHPCNYDYKMILTWLDLWS